LEGTMKTIDITFDVYSDTPIGKDLMLIALLLGLTISFFGISLYPVDQDFF